MRLKARYINAGGRLIDLEIPRVMGILNITPDSFYPGSRFNSEEEIIVAARKMIEDGADILDIGGYSTRPGAKVVTARDERKRVISAIKLIKRELPEPVISVDTFRSDIALEAVLEAGANMVNDISGGEGDSNMFKGIVRLNVPYILMHMKGVPATMQKNPVYDDIVTDILKWMGRGYSGYSRQA